MEGEVERAVAILKTGGLVAFPTETVYGLGADADNPDAVRRIFAAKGRLPGRALSVHLGPLSDFSQWAAWDDRAQALARRFWPGPLTIILLRTSRVHDVVTGGRDTVGLRVSSHPLCVALLHAFGGGVAAPSANRSGHVSPTTAAHVRAELGDAVDLILDGGACPVGVESTVLTLAEERPRILRIGAAPVEAIREVLDDVIVPETGAQARYAPRTPLRVLPAAVLTEAAAEVGGPVAVVSPARVHGAEVHWVRAPDGAEAWARDLYGILRDLDRGAFQAILVAEVPRGGLWDAVADRLHAAGHGRGQNG